MQTDSWINAIATINKNNWFQKIEQVCLYRKKVVFSMQKHSFWNTKVWFLECKSMVFGMQKYSSKNVDLWF